MKPHIGVVVGGVEGGGEEGAGGAAARGDLSCAAMEGGQSGGEGEAVEPLGVCRGYDVVGRGEDGQTSSGHVFVEGLEEGGKDVGGDDT